MVRCQAKQTAVQTKRENNPAASLSAGKLRTENLVGGS